MKLSLFSLVAVTSLANQVLVVSAALDRTVLTRELRMGMKKKEAKSPKSPRSPMGRGKGKGSTASPTAAPTVSAAPSTSAAPSVCVPPDADLYTLAPTPSPTKSMMSMMGKSSRRVLRMKKKASTKSAKAGKSGKGKGSTAAPTAAVRWLEINVGRTWHCQPNSLLLLIAASATRTAP